jgi:rubrerythrin
MATINQPYNGFAAQAREATEKLQRVVIANVELATKWTELVAAFSGAPAVRPGNVGDVVQDGTDAVVDAVQDSIEAVVDSAADISVAAEPFVAKETNEAEERDRAHAAERAEAKHAHELAREPYLSLTKAELSALLAERGLPKTGTINTLIERLVSADAL